MFNSPKGLRSMEFRAVLVFILLAGLYFIFGHEGQAVDVRLVDRFAFVAFGEQGGVTVYKVRNPQKPAPTATPYLTPTLSPTPTLTPTTGPTPSISPTPTPVRLEKFDSLLKRPDKTLLNQPERQGSYEPPGRVTSLAVSGNMIYIVNPLQGLYILNGEDLTQPKEAGFITLVGANDVQVRRGMAFVTAGEAGLYILDVSHPANIRPLYQLDIDGLTSGVALFSPRPLQPLTSRWRGNLEERIAYPKDETFKVFVAAGKYGVAEYEINAYRNPRQVRQYDTPGTANKVLIKDFRLYVADGKTGVCVQDIFQDPDTTQLTCVDTPGNTQDVFVQKGTIYVADGKSGLRLLRPADDPVLAGEAGAFDSYGDAQSIWVSRDLAYLGDGNMGMWVIDVSNPANLNMKAFLEPPGEADPYRLAQAFLHPELITPGIQETVKNLSIYTLFVSSGFVILLVFLAQFALPVRSLVERIQAVLYLVWFMLRRHERLIFIKNGKFLAWEEEIDSDKARVVLVDQASAAAIENSNNEWHVVGPGVTFLQAGEQIARTIDLRPQVRTYGPTFEENVFSAEDGFTTEERQQRQKRRLQTSTVTADGLEIVATIVVEAKVKSQPGSGGSPYGFDAEHALRAMHTEVSVYEELTSLPQPAVNWESYLERRVVECWKKHISQEELLNLFHKAQAGLGGAAQEALQTRLEQVIEAVRSELTTPFNDELDEQGRPVEGPPTHTGYRRLVEFGLEVLSLRIINLQFHPIEESRLEVDWESTWQAQASQEKEAAEQEVDQAASREKRQAKIQYTRGAIQPLSGSIKGYGPRVYLLKIKEALHHLAAGTLSVGELTPEVEAGLREILEQTR
jgi:hypothetical protein